MTRTEPIPVHESSGCLDRWFTDAAMRGLAANTMVDAIGQFGRESPGWALLAIRSQYDGMPRLQLTGREVSSPAYA